MNKLLMCQHDYIKNPLITFMCVYKATQVEIPCKTDLYLHEAKTLRLNSNFDQNRINLEFMGRNCLGDCMRNLEAFLYC